MYSVPKVKDMMLGVMENMNMNKIRGGDWGEPGEVPRAHNLRRAHSQGHANIDI